MDHDKPLINLNKITKSYDKEVLNIDKLTFKKGNIYGIIGPSGAGKSTLLRILNLLTLPDSGSMLFDGQQVFFNKTNHLALQRKMAMVFQKTLLFYGSVYSNVAYGLKARGWHRNEINERVYSLLKQVGMEELAVRRADTLSGGEAQRVAIVRAVACEPDLLLLDEPTANLDPVNIEIIEKMLVELNQAYAITVVIVTHNIFQARRIADQVIFINEGKIIEVGDTEQIFHSPKNTLTRAYIEGTMVY